MLSDNIIEQRAFGLSARPYFYFVYYLYIPQLDQCRYRISQFSFKPNQDSIAIPENLISEIQINPANNFWETMVDDLPDNQIVHFKVDSFAFFIDPAKAPPSEYDQFANSPFIFDLNGGYFATSSDFQLYCYCSIQVTYQGETPDDKEVISYSGSASSSLFTNTVIDYFIKNSPK